MPLLWDAQLWHGALGDLTVIDVNNPGNPASYFLGYATVALALLGLRVRTLGLACGAVIIGMFACGTSAHWTRQPEGAVAMPWLPLSWLAGMAWAGVIHNVRSFTCAIPAPLVVLAGVGLARFPTRVIVPVACVASLLDAPGFGIPSNAIEVPAAYQELATRPPATLLELPSGVTESGGGLGLNYTASIDNNVAMYFQVVHRKRRVAGYAGRVPQSTFEWFFHEPVIGDLLTLTSEGGTFECYHHERRHLDHLPDYPPDVVDHFVAEFDLGYVLLRPGPDQRRYMEEVDRLLGARIARRSTIGDYALYELTRGGP